jgi:hypothetical protein
MKEQAGKDPEATRHRLRRGQRRHQRVPGRPWTFAEQQQALTWRREGLSRQQIADKTGRSLFAIRHLLARMRPAYACPVCRRELPAASFGWSRQPGTPPCRECAGRRRIASRPEVVTVSLERASRLAFRRQREAVGDPMPITIDKAPTGHEGAILTGSDETGYRSRCACGFASIVRQTSDGAIDEARRHGRRIVLDADREQRVIQITAEIDLGIYVLPTGQQWRDRLDEPEVLGLLLHDLVSEAKLLTQPKGTRVGRRPSRYFTRDEAIELLPPALLATLPIEVE